MEGGQNKGLKEIHEESVSWRSDLKFCCDEYNFFEKLLNSYKYVPDNKIDFDLREELLGVFRGLKISGEAIQGEVTEHMNRLSGFYEQEQTTPGNPYLDEHRALEQRITDFKMEFRHFKQRLFEMADRILESKKPDRPNHKN